MAGPVVPAGRVHQQHDRHRRERPDRVPVVERVGQPRPELRRELLQRLRREERRLQPAEHSQDHHRDDPNWLNIGSGGWDHEGRVSWVRLDRVLDVPEEGIRREGAVLDRTTFEVIAARLRAEYSWS